MTAGYVDKKNEIAVMMKVAANVILSGLGYWLFGFGLTYGTTFLDSQFVGLGCFFVKAKSDDVMGRVYAPYLFQVLIIYQIINFLRGFIARNKRYRIVISG